MPLLWRQTVIRSVPHPLAVSTKQRLISGKQNTPGLGVRGVSPKAGKNMHL